METVALKTMMQKWRDELINNQSINDYCQAKYGRRPKVMVGTGGQPALTDGDYPCIAICPGIKFEGLKRELYTYNLSVEWTVKNDTVTVDADHNVSEVQGIYDCDDLGQLIWLALANVNPEAPITRVKYDMTEKSQFPLFMGTMGLRTAITPTMGGHVIY